MNMGRKNLDWMLTFVAAARDAAFRASKTENG
jgi:hypothetical protein